MMPDGYIKIVDRKKDMILVSGFNVYPNEIEDVIASHPGVLECAVIGVPDTKSGEAVKAFVVKKDPNVTAEDIILFLRHPIDPLQDPQADRIPGHPAQDQCRQNPAPRAARRNQGRGLSTDPQSSHQVKWFPSRRKMLLRNTQHH